MRLLCPLIAFAVLLLSPVAASAADRNLTIGDRGAAVAEVRSQLASLGFLPRGGGDQYDQAAFHAVMAFQKVRGLARDGIAGPITRNALERDARVGRRPVPARAGSGRRIEVDLSQQVAKLIGGRRVKRTIAISSGAPGYSTPTGSYRIFRKEQRSWSVPYRVWLPWASYFVGGIAFHAYPSVPASPASHGCVRVPEPFAQELYEFARMGVRVDVIA